MADDTAWKELCVYVSRRQKEALLVKIPIYCEVLVFSRLGLREKLSPGSTAIAIAIALVFVYIAYYSPVKEMKISFNKDKVIGKGSNGTVVYEGEVGDRPVAVKRIVKTAYPDLGDREITNLIKLDWHPNVTTYYSREIDKDFIYIAIELCSSNLAGYISKASAQLRRANGYPSIQLIKLMHDMVVGLAHLHRHKFVHRDLKPQNVLISKKSSPSAMLSEIRVLFSNKSIQVFCTCDILV